MACKSIKPSGCGGQGNGCSSTREGFCYSNDYTPLKTLRDQVYGDLDGKVHPHQRRVGSDILDEAIRVLHSAGFDSAGQYFSNGNPTGFVDFEELYDFVEGKLGHINGIGGLTIYDIAVRIGWHQNPRVLPKDYVYIHAGTKVGAEKVLGIRIIGKRIPFSFFNGLSRLSGLDALELEDYLCIHKNQL